MNEVLHKKRPERNKRQRRVQKRAEGRRTRGISKGELGTCREVHTAPPVEIEEETNENPVKRALFASNKQRKDLGSQRGEAPTVETKKQRCNGWLGGPFQELTDCCQVPTRKKRRFRSRS